MSARTVNSKGELKVTKTDVSDVETNQRSTEQILEDILLQLKAIRLGVESVIGPIPEEE